MLTFRASRLVVAYHAFRGEAHGFRNAETIVPCWRRSWRSAARTEVGVNLRPLPRVDDCSMHSVSTAKVRT